MKERAQTTRRQRAAYRECGPNSHAQDTRSHRSVFPRAGLSSLLCLLAFAVQAQDPTAPRAALTARCYYPGTIVLRWPAAKDESAAVFRAGPADAETKIADVPPGGDMHYDVGLSPGGRFRYRVAIGGGKGHGPVCCRNSAELLSGGGFEAEALGPLRQTADFHRAYGDPWWEVVERARPDSAGTRSLRIRHGQPPRRDGLHSELIPVDPAAPLRQTGWLRAGERASGRLGRQLLTSDLSPAGGRIVSYSYAPVFREAEDGWLFVQQRLDSLPADTAYAQVWALAFETREDVWFDDLSLVDERVERLQNFEAGEHVTTLLALADHTQDHELQTEARDIATTVRTMRTTLEAPQGMPLAGYLEAVGCLDAAVRRIEELTWDLRMLELAR